MVSTYHHFWTSDVWYWPTPTYQKPSTLQVIAIFLLTRCWTCVSSKYQPAYPVMERSPLHSFDGNLFNLSQLNQGRLSAASFQTPKAVDQQLFICTVWRVRLHCATFGNMYAYAEYVILRSQHARPFHRHSTKAIQPCHFKVLVHIPREMPLYRREWWRNKRPTDYFAAPGTHNIYRAQASIILYELTYLDINRCRTCKLFHGLKSCCAIGRSIDRPLFGWGEEQCAMLQATGRC